MDQKLYTESTSQQPADAAEYALGERCICIHQMAALFAWNDVTAAILKQ